MKRRLLNFGNSSVELMAGEGRPAELVRFLFGDMPEDGAGEPWTGFRLEDQGEGEGLLLWRDGKLISRQRTVGRMADRLMGQVCFTLAHESRDGLLLHAAAVYANGRGIILPGKSGAGKSTLAAWLASNGADYSTDEMVFITNNDRLASGFTRPITVKPQARHLMTPLLKANSPGAGIQVREPVEMISPDRFGARVVTGDMALDMIVFPLYQADRGLTEVERLSKAQAAFELMTCLANARNLADHGLTEAVRLAEQTPAFSLTFSDLTPAGRAILNLASSATED